MPTYGYECTACKEQFEVFQRMTEDPLAIHEGCGGELRRLLYPVGIVFKGPGFHVNDYGKSGKKNTGAGSVKAESVESSAATPAIQTETKSETKADTKADAKAETAAPAKAD